MKTFTALCSHIDAHGRKLKLFPDDELTAIPSKPEVVADVIFIDLIGRNLDDIISNIKNPPFGIKYYNQIICRQTSFDSSSLLFAIWVYDNRIFLFKLSIRTAHKYLSNPLCDVYYELQKMWEIVGTTNSLLNIMGVDGLTYLQISKYMQDYKEDFILLASAI